jgi:hypothetical protein
MPMLAAFLRAINVGGHTVTMAALRQEFEALDLKDVETFIASGNVIFSAPSGNRAALARKIEGHLQSALNRVGSSGDRGLSAVQRCEGPRRADAERRVPRGTPAACGGETADGDAHAH